MLQRAVSYDGPFNCHSLLIICQILIMMTLEHDDAHVDSLILIEHHTIRVNQISSFKSRV